MPLSDIVDVIITRQTATVTEQGFGTPLILGTNTRFNDDIRFYTSMDEVALDFVSTDAEYIAAQDIFSQPISPARIAIGRRQVDAVQIAVETAMPGVDYSITINGDVVLVPNTTTATYDTVTLNNDLVTGNRISVAVNGTEVGTVTSVINFSTDFGAGSSILPTVNGVDLTAVAYTMDQATTIAAVATRIASAAGTPTATVTAPDQITVVFAAPGNNTVDSVVTTGGNAPTATISEGGFIYNASSAQTMQDIADAITALGGTIQSATVSGPTSRILTVLGTPANTVTVNRFSITGGASQPIATIAINLQPITAASIATRFVAAINADVSLPVTATNNGNGLFTVNNKVPGTPFTLFTGSTIVRPINARVTITQVSPNQTYTVTINGVSFTYIAPNNIQSALPIVTALVDLINLNIPLAVTATNNNDGSFELASDEISDTFSLSVTPEMMTAQQGLIINPLTPANSVTDDLDRINDTDSSWYALIATDRDVTTVKAIAAWVQTRIKLFGTASSDVKIINVAAGSDSGPTASIAAFLNQMGYTRTFVMYHQDADYDNPEAAWFGAVLPLEPGSETWKFKQLATISYSNLTTTQALNATNKKANIYTFLAGVGITAEGTVAQGEFIDIIRGIDWLTARIQEFVFGVLVNNPKIPYTDAGIATIQSQVMAVLSLGVSNNFLSSTPIPKVTVPLAVNVPGADKAARILRNVKFTATLAGAIHFVSIRGNLSL